MFPQTEVEVGEMRSAKDVAVSRLEAQRSPECIDGGSRVSEYLQPPVRVGVDVGLKRPSVAVENAVGVIDETKREGLRNGRVGEAGVPNRNPRHLPSTN